MIRGKYDQAKCQECGSWHFALQLDENMNIVELKCCRCGRLIPYKPKIRVKQ